MTREHLAADRAAEPPIVTRSPGRPVVVVPPDLTDIAETCAWLVAHRHDLRALLDDAGAVYVRGLAFADPAGFAAVRDVLLEERAQYREKATPRHTVGDDVFSSTDLPPAQPIRLHNENSYTLTFPGTLLFGCLVAPDEGGATPVADCRAVLAALPPALVDRFRRYGWALHRCYGEYLSLDWRSAFGTDDKAEVERYCRANLISWQWEGERLRTVQRRPAIIRHPSTGEEVWFNHVAFWSEWALDPDVREVLVSELGPDGLPFATTLGDGSALSPAEIDELDRAYRAATVAHPWSPGDLLVVDNVLAAHGREAFRGDRRIVVAMGEPTAVTDCSPTSAPSATLVVGWAS